MLERRTSITTSTITTPAKAAADEAWPEGNDWVVSRPDLFCHGGRPRPIWILRKVVSSEVVTITPIANSAARWCFLASIAPARRAVSTVMPMVANAVSTTLSGWRSQGSWTAHPSAGPPRSSMRVIGPQPLVTSSAITANRAKQSNAQLSVVRRDRSSTRVPSVVSAGRRRRAQYAGAVRSGAEPG